MSNHGNLEQGKEFRKLASLNFLYEINEFGKVRNVKSKRYLRHFLNNETGMCTVSVIINKKKICRSIARLVAEAWIRPIPVGYIIIHDDGNSSNNHYSNLKIIPRSFSSNNQGGVKKPVEIIFNDENIYFESITECAKYIAKRTEKKINTVATRLNRKRSHIYGYDINYFPVCRD